MLNTYLNSYLFIVPSPWPRRDWKRITWAHSNWMFDCVHSTLCGNGDLTHLAQFKTDRSCSLATLWMELLVFVVFQILHEVRTAELSKLSKCVFFRLQCTSGTLKLSSHLFCLRPEVHMKWFGRVQLRRNRIYIRTNVVRITNSVWYMFTLTD